MDAVIGPVIIGVFLVVLGISNMKGNIAPVHSYHRKRIPEKDIPAFGKAIGRATVVCGVSIIVYGIFALVSLLSEIDVFLIIGAAIVITGLAVGMSMSIYAIIKYNKGIF